MTNVKRSVIILGDCDYESSTVKIVLLAPKEMTKRAAPDRLVHEFTAKGGNPKDYAAFATWLESKGFERLNFQERYLSLR